MSTNRRVILCQCIALGGVVLMTGSAAVAQTGACCVLNGSCVETLPEQCTGSNQFQGVGVPCDPSPCPPTGACCLTQGSCLALTQHACEEIEGPEAYAGDGTTCDAIDPCADLPGPCCLSGNECQVKTKSECDDLGGQYQGPFLDCSVNLCGTGACCLANNSCLVLEGIFCILDFEDAEFKGAGTVCDPDPCVQQVGACCLTGGTCELRTGVECDDLPGVYQGDGTVCAPNPCPATGACCSNSGVCSIETEADCTFVGSQYQGDFTTCDPSPCFQPEGACCISPNECIETTEEDCRLVQRGLPMGPGTICDEVECPGGDAVGACCFLLDTPDCEERSFDSCFETLGVFFGFGTTCGPDVVCGACCLDDGTCQELANSTCDAFGGLLVVGGDCDDSSFCIGACCLDDGTCFLESIANVGQNGSCGEFEEGIFQGAGTTCNPNPCSTGACCLDDGTCTPLQSEAECVGSGGTFRGQGSVCLPNPCNQGACCFDDGACTDGSELDCLNAGGAFKEGQACANDPCPEGACCLQNDACVILFETACEAVAGSFLGDGTICPAGNPCITGACCAADGNCTLGTDADCLALGGTFNEGILCAQNPCTGACCADDGATCTQTTEANCAGGFFLGNGTLCGVDACPGPLPGGDEIPRGACCFDDGSCIEQPRAQCNTDGGEYQGDGTFCVGENADECPASTVLNQPVNSGNTELSVDSEDGFKTGDRVVINPSGGNQEQGEVVGFGSIILAAPLQFDHQAGESIVVLVPADPGTQPMPPGCAPLCATGTAGFIALMLGVIAVLRRTQRRAR